MDKHHIHTYAHVTSILVSDMPVGKDLDIGESIVFTCETKVAQLLLAPILLHSSSGSDCPPDLPKLDSNV